MKDFFVHFAPLFRLNRWQLMEPDTNRLVDSACRGDNAAAVQIIELFYGRIYAYLRRLAGNDADAADLTQRTFSSVWQALPTFAGRSSVASWIHGIAHHVYVDWRRAHRHTEPRSDEWWAARPATGPAPDEIAARSDLAASLYAAVDRLEPDQRDAVHLHYYQGLTLQETADAQGVATSTVKYRLRLALAELQKKFSSERTELKSPTTPQTI
jgi:RNA polymerase sigma-70 factor, ECF subfamily